MKKKLIMVMGVQRSGTTALFWSLAKDSNLTAFHESFDDAIYYLFRLRPLGEIAPILQAAPGAILLKPLSETRSLGELQAEYAGYELRFVWIYRDPINVLHSMSRKGWLPDGQENEAAANWVIRNDLALQFQRANPAGIAVVRYEDLIADKKVFHALCASLGVKGRQSFREDRGEGRAGLPAATQQTISALTEPTLRALDAARSFRPGRLSQWKFNAAARIPSWPRKRRGQAPILHAPEEWAAGVTATTAQLPSEFGNLLFWLDAARLDPRESRIHQIIESGPLQLRAMIDDQPPFCIPYLNRKPALFFPAIKAPKRLTEDPGLLRFVATGSAVHQPLHRGLSGFALIRPQIPQNIRCDQERMIVLRLGWANESTELSLEWDPTRWISRMLLRGPEEVCSVETVNGSHLNEQWRLIYFRIPAEKNAPFLISADGIASTAFARQESELPKSNHPCRWHIEIGGWEGLPAALFYGAIAEVILFECALETREEFALTRYLKEKYRR